MLPPDLQGLATRWLASLPGRASHPLDYATLPGRTLGPTPDPPQIFLKKAGAAIEAAPAFLRAVAGRFRSMRRANPLEKRMDSKVRFSTSW